MAIQTINIGNRVNDGLGDDLRTAFEKVNANFAELDSELSVEGINVGPNGVGIYKQKTDGNLQFKSLVPGNRIAINDTTDTVVIDNTAPIAFTSVSTLSGTINASSYPSFGLEARTAVDAITEQPDIRITTNGGSKLLFRTDLPFTEILTTYDFGPLGEVTDPGGNPVLLPGEAITPAENFDASKQFKYTTQLALAGSNIDFGTLTFESRLNLDCGVIG